MTKIVSGFSSFSDQKRKIVFCDPKSTTVGTFRPKHCPFIPIDFLNKENYEETRCFFESWIPSSSVVRPFDVPVSEKKLKTTGIEDTHTR